MILAGGFGARLWPLSQKNYPKQFLKLTGDKSLLQQAMVGLKEVRFDPPIITCNQVHESLVVSQCRQSEISPNFIFSEPIPLGTAGAIALAAIRENSRCVNSVLLALPVDSYFEDTDGFREAVENSIAIAQRGRIVMFGVPPKSADTNYGYIRKGCSLPGGASAVSSFHEKPILELAQLYVQSDDYYWNSGILLFRSQDYLTELNAYRPDIFDACSELAASECVESNIVRFAARPLELSVESVEKAVLEQSSLTVVKTCDQPWLDVGSWPSLSNAKSRDSDGNVIAGNVVSMNTRNSVLLSHNRLLSTVGIENAIVVETADAVLVANRDNIHEIKTLTEKIRKTSPNKSDKRPLGVGVYNNFGTQ